MAMPNLPRVMPRVMPRVKCLIINKCLGCLGFFALTGAHPRIYTHTRTHMRAPTSICPRHPRHPRHALFLLRFFCLG